MKIRNTTIISRVDRLPLSVMVVTPEGEPWCLVQIVHGMCEFKERYLPFMEYLADRGIASVIHDHRGHGQSVYGERDLGYMYGGGSRALVQDTRLVTARLRRKYGKKLPLAIVGHSMGSLVVRAYLKKYDRLADAVILCGSPSKNSFVRLGQAIARMEGIFLGGHHPSRALQALSFGPYAARFPKEESSYSWICSDREVVRLPSVRFSLYRRWLSGAVRTDGADLFRQRLGVRKAGPSDPLYQRRGRPLYGKCAEV